MATSPDSLTIHFSEHHNNNTPAKIALINIMDNASGTEKHFTQTINAVHPNAHITLCRMSCAKIDKKYFRENDFLLTDRYVDWHEVIGRQEFDLVIVTGINRGTLSYDDLNEQYYDFWQESCELFGAIQQSIKTNHTGHATLICWSAFAAMKALYGVEKGIHEEKLYGLFEHEIENQFHPLVQNINSKKIIIPQSRYSFMNNTDLRDVIKNHNGEVVMNAVGEPAIWTLENNRITCFINHLEYRQDTLKREYLRDSNDGKTNFPLPQNYDPNNIETPEINAVFETLDVSCAAFYQNLISLAVSQKETIQMNYIFKDLGFGASIFD